MEDYRSGWFFLWEEKIDITLILLLVDSTALEMVIITMINSKICKMLLLTAD